MSLILHVGFPKTGTTTIQESFLKTCPGYIGKYKNQNIKERRLVVESLSEVALHHWSMDEIVVQERTRKWVERIVSSDVNCNLDGPIIISNEGLTHWPIRSDSFLMSPLGAKERVEGEVRRKPAPLVGFLRKYLVPAWSSATGDDGSIKIIITIRNQADWLASHYVQSSSKRRNASQADFENQIANLLKHDDPYTDWNAWVEGLQSAVGERNVTVLLFEEMGKREFWEQISRPIGLTDIQSDFMTRSNAPRKNVRRLDEGRWAIKPSYWASNFIKRHCPSSVPWRRNVVGATRKILDPVFDPFVLRLFERHRGESITVTKDLRERIHAHYSKSNEQLAERLGRDLSSFGY